MALVKATIRKVAMMHRQKRAAARSWARVGDGAAWMLLVAMISFTLFALACGTTNSGYQGTPAASSQGTRQPSTPYAPTITPSAFSNKITNRYFPLVPGTTYVFEGKKNGIPQRDEVTVTRDTKMILGVRCVVVHDVVTQRGELHEETYDWYAQDRAGNVWYFGEDSKEFAGGEVSSTAGSWEAGVAGAQPGIIMEAAPKVGDRYRQEYYEGEAEDMAKVLSVSKSLDVMGSPYSGVVVTEDFTALDPTQVENKYFAPGLGFVLGRVVKGGTGETTLVQVIKG